MDKSVIIWFSGMSGSGKSTVADAIAKVLDSLGVGHKRLDGDVARKTFSKDLGFSIEDRAENCRRAAVVATYLQSEYGVILASFISPTKQIRNKIRSIIGDGYMEVYVECPIDECKRRDPKGMYAQITDGCFKNVPFTGMHSDAPYNPPQNPDLILHTHNETVDESVDKVISYLNSRRMI